MNVEAYLHEHIPLSYAMGVKVEKATPHEVILWAPLTPNINHKQTAFGGSLHSIATLACWTYLYVNLLKENVQIVIRKSDTEYLAPVEGDFKALCQIPSQEEWDTFLKMLHSKKKGRITLHSKIYFNNRLCVDYSGVFVALKK
jgi:thioesterase domain-containing protein